MTAWRGWAVAVGVVMAACGIWLWSATSNPVLLIVGALVVLTALLEPAYGRLLGRPAGGSWRATGERFVDPETGKLVTVWFDPATGKRRYVADGEPPLA